MIEHAQVELVPQPEAKRQSSLTRLT